MQQYHRRTPPPRRRRRTTKRTQQRRLALLLLAGLCVAVLLFVLLFRPGSTPNKAPEALTPPYTIMLDAGHGGGDVGAEGLVQEVEMTERTVALLNEMLENDQNFTPQLTRAAGEGATVAERARAAQKANAALLLSVHGNSDTSPATTGFECFPTPPGRTYHDESLQLANLLAAEMGGAGAKLRGEGGVRYAYYENTDEAAKIFREASDTSVYEEQSFGVVEKSGCPSVLVEQCFITSPEDMAAFGDEAGCYRAAVCYYRAICAYFGTQPML